MSTVKFNKPRLPTHYYVWFEPPDHSGDEVLHFASAQRRIKLKGHSFREFQQYVIPLLDGKHTLAEIEESVADVFAPQDLEAGLQLLASQHLLEDAAGQEIPTQLAARLEPQLNFFHEMNINPVEQQSRLARSTVTILGLGGAGATAALTLAACGVGNLRCFDPQPVAPTDIYLSQAFSLADVGEVRASVVARKIAAAAPEVTVTVHTQNLENDEAVLAMIAGSDFIINCLDQGQSSLMYKLNRACLASNLNWTSCALSGVEIVIGPTVHPFETACYLCYKMRTVACAGNPEDEFSFESFLDQRKQDDSGRHENLVFGAGIAAHLVSLEALKELSTVFSSSTVGKITVFNLLELTSAKHVVLRKPWCPACFKKEAATEVSTAASTVGTGVPHEHT
jgi:adenylyltransferase/sulfurtransferase